MTPEIDTSGLKKIRVWEYLLRFVFGAVVTGCAGLIARAWGPLVGGLFLAFPSILPASLTLVKQHGGRAKAIDDARGGTLGGVGLAVFGVVVWSAVHHAAAWIVLSAAMIAWVLADVGLWSATLGRKEESPR